MSWDGVKRRASDKREIINLTDHDMLIEIHTSMNALIDNVDEHIKEDKEEFKKQDKRLNLLERVYGVGIAVLVTMEIVLKWIK